MGFMDNTAGNAVKKFGVVTEGKHQNCIMTMDNGAGKGGNAVYSQIAFYENGQEQGRYMVREDLQAVHYVTYQTGGPVVQIKFKTGEECTCQLLVIKSDGFFVSLLKIFMNKQETYEERENRLHSNITSFFASTLGLINGEDLHQFSECFRLWGLYKTDPALKQMVDEYKELCKED